MVGPAVASRLRRSCGLGVAVGRGGRHDRHAILGGRGGWCGGGRGGCRRSDGGRSVGALRGLPRCLGGGGLAGRLLLGAGLLVGASLLVAPGLLAAFRGVRGLRRSGRAHGCRERRGGHEHGRRRGDGRVLRVHADRVLGRARQVDRGGLVLAADLVADDLPADQLDHALLHLVDDAGVVGGHDHRGAVGVDPLEHLHDPRARQRVEVARGLVGEEHGRLVDHGAGDGHALLLAAGELVREALLLALEAHHGEHVRDGLLDEAARLADHLEGEGDVVEDRLVREQPEVLEHNPQAAPVVRDLAARQLVQLLAQDVDRAVGRPVLLEHETQEAGLA
ncbi:hypothetical protein CMMCAS03_05605 [Clavibacter michiganensis subsp. michiganensis]|nr:hypothetical protein CMMCAS03_05605 [Clavibacter michiganensis subsp. michiganensis]OUE15909.1 hypothetical protein CMMCA002_07100 [Clavibacter michiganensis subsp. michiganensis]